jgi:MFS family permease
MTTVDSSFRAWVVCLSAALFFFFGYMQVNVFNALNPYLYTAFHLTSETQLGRLSAMYFYANVIFLFPAGIILDYVSTRKLILSMMVLCIICTALFAMTQTLWQAELIRFVTGIGGAFFLLSNIQLASRWFPPRKMALVIGVIVTLAMVGGMAAQTPLTLMAEHYGWRHTMLADAALGAIVFIIMVFLVRDRPVTEVNIKNVVEDMGDSRLGFWQSLICSLGNVQNWLAGIYASMLNLPLFFLGATFGSMYFVQVYGFSRDRASLIIMMLFLGMIFGSPAMGWLSDHLRRRKLPMIIGALLSLTMVLLIMYLPHEGLATLMMLMFLYGFISGAQIISYPLIAESNSKLLTGTSEGIASVLIMSGGLLIPVFPWLLDLHWTHMMVHHLPFYSATDFRLAFMIMPVAAGIALLVSLLIKETGCVSYAERQGKDIT